MKGVNLQVPDDLYQAMKDAIEERAEQYKDRVSIQSWINRAIELRLELLNENK